MNKFDKPWKCANWLLFQFTIYCILQFIIHNIQDYIILCRSDGPASKYSDKFNIFTDLDHSVITIAIKNRRVKYEKAQQDEQRSCTHPPKALTIINSKKRRAISRVSGKADVSSPFYCGNILPPTGQFHFIFLLFITIYYHYQLFDIKFCAGFISAICGCAYCWHRNMWLNL